MMNCGALKTRLGRFLDGELSPPELAEIEAHIRGCPSCQQELQALHALSASLDALIVPPVPAGIAPGTMAHIRQQKARLRRSWGALGFWQPWPVAMRFAAVGTAVVACLIGLTLGSATPSRTPSEMAWVGLASGAPITSAYLETAR
jgi:anti-sigma factor RsiW